MLSQNERYKWFQEARFGMFIHWGLYSLLGRGEWVRYMEDIPTDEYRKLANQFNPRHFDAMQLAELAKRSGMRYMVLTTKHHDGLCLFDSAYTDFTSAKTAAKRDFVREYTDACRAVGLGVGLYFSVKDWTFPGYFKGPEGDPEGWAKMVEHFHNQTLELMSNYGKIDILWYDCADDANFRGGWGDKTPQIWRSHELNAKVRAIQPDILINNRSGLAEDFGTPENEIMQAVGNTDRMFESCMTMNSHWGFCQSDRSWKSAETLIWHLIACACRGCNYLLNVGPDGDGRIPEAAIDRLNEIGDWVRENGSAIYDTERLLPDWWDYTSTGRIATKGNSAYVIVDSLEGRGEIVVTSLKNEVIRAEILPGNGMLKAERRDRRIVISGFSSEPGSGLPRVIHLELDGPVPQYYY